MTRGFGCLLVALAVSCGSAARPGTSTARARGVAPPASLYADIGGDSEGPEPTPAPSAEGPSGCAPGVARLSDGNCVPVAPTGSAAEPPPPPPPKPGTVRGGLARGTADEADRKLYDADRAWLADDVASAKRDYAAAKKLAPKDPAPRVGLVRVALAELDVPTDYGAAPQHPKVKALLKELDAIAKLDPQYGPTFIERGRVLLVLGRGDEALAALRRAVELSYGDPEAHSALGVALLATGDGENALTELKRASELDPDDAERMTNLGTAYLLRGQVDAAIRVFERAAEKAPNDPRVLGDLGTAYLAANKSEQAIAKLVRAVELAPDRATYLSNLGYAYQLAGELDRAIILFRKAVERDPKLGSAWINLGVALAKKKDWAEAERALRRALALDPEDPRAQANLEELAAARKGQ